MPISLKTNLTSMMTRRNLNDANAALKDNIQKLSTGYRINSAADDAAGLAVSEGMKADIRSIEQAKRNAQDAVSMLQTAEGSLGEVHDILGRMKELSVQANSDSISDDHRQDLNEELVQLTKEVDDIAHDTNFNDVKLLDGSFVDKSLQVGTKASDTLGLAISQNFDPGVFGQQETFMSNADMKLVSGGGNNHLKFCAASFGKQFATGKSYVLEDQDGNSVTTQVNNVLQDGVVVSFDTDLNGAGLHTSEKIDMRLDGGLSSIDIKTKSAASFAASVVNDAIADLSTERGKLGAQINRLDVKLNNLDIRKQNLEASNSRIRDVDVAKEMAEQTKNQILTQAGTTMLSQANSMPRTALSLLGGGG